MSSLLKKIIVSFFILSFVAIIFFSFAVMVKEPNGRMSENCPFSAMGVSLCPQNIMAMVFHHTSAYESFINIPVSSGVAALISLLLIASAILINFLNSLSPGLFAPFGIFHNLSPNTSYKKKTTHWLALHENSPAVF